MKMFNKALALLLAIVMIMGVAPLSAFSAKTKDAKATAKQKSVDTKNLKIIGEVEEKRDEFSKTFELEDGTFYEVKSSEPLHVKKLNKWVDSKKVSDPKTVSDINNTVKQLTETERETQTRDGNDVSNNTSNYDYRYLQDNSSAYNLDSINDDTLLLLKDTSTMTINQAELTYSYIVTLTLNPNVNQNNSNLPKQEVGGFVCTDSWTPYSSQQQTPVDDFDDYYYPSISGAECIGTHTISSSGDYSFDATYIYNRWESGAQANYGLCFVGHADSDIEAVFSGVTFSRRYKNISALDTKTTYHTIDMGFAGGAYINDYHNTVDIIRDEIGLPNNTLPVEIKRMISQNNLGEAYYYGDNAYINYHSVMSNQGQTYTWRSLNFETVTFTVSNTSQATSDNEDLGYSLTVSTKTITGPGGRIYKFGTYNSNYYLTSVKDAYDNEITVAYKTSNYKRRINYVEEKANGRRYLFDYTTTSFSYNGNSFSRDVLSSITVKQKSGRDYNNVSIGNAVARVTYLYAPSSSSTFVLQRATYPDNSFIQYTYNNSGKITQAKDIDGRVVTFDYSGTIPKYSLSNYTISQTNIARSTAGFVGYDEKVENVDDNSSQYITKSSLSVKNHYAFRRAYDSDGSHVETTFDNEFRPKYVVDNVGDTYLFEYGATNNCTQIKKHNSVENIIYNGNFEEGIDGWELKDDTNGTEITDSILTFPNGNSTGVMNITSLETTEYSVAYQIIDASDLEIDKTYILDAEAYLNSGACIGDHFNGVELYACDSDGNIAIGATPLVSLTFGEGTPYEKEHKCGYFVFDNDEIENFAVVIKYTPQFFEGFFDNISLIMDETDSLVNTYPTSGNGEITTSSEPTPAPTETYNRDSHGLPLEHILTANNQTMVEKFTYNSAAPYNTASHTDWNNVLTSFNYSNDTGLLTSKTKNSATTSYTYNQLGLLASVSTVFNNISNNPVTIANSYTYSDNRIASVTHGSMVYSFTYDSLGRVKGVNYSNDSGATSTALVSSSYANGKVDTITYANGDQIKYTYDTNTKNITKISFKDTNDNAFTDMATYQYNVGSGEKIRINDLNSDRRISIFEDGSYSVTDKNTNSVLPELRLFKTQVNSNGVERSNIFDFKYDYSHNEPDPQSDTITTSSTLNLYIDEVPASFTFTENNEQISIVYGGIHSEDPLSLTTEMTKDSFGRVTNTNAHYETEDEEERMINNEYGYKNYHTDINGTPSSAATSNLLSVYSTSTTSETDLDYDCTFNYEYEEDSDLVKKITYSNSNESDQTYAYFKYDALGQMVMEYNQHTGNITLYTYNANGNITQKKWFSEASVTFDNRTDFIYHMNSTYSYEKIDFVYSTTNPNQLVSYQQFNGEHTSNGDVETPASTNYSISYDANGNALSTFAKGASTSDYYTLTWNGNLLASAENSSKCYKYKYDSDNQLIEKDYYRKNNNGSLTLNSVEQYVWNNGRIEGFEIYDVELEIMRFSVKYLYDENNQLLGMIPHVKMIWTGADLPEFQSNYESLPFATDKVIWFVNDGQGNIVSVYSEDREVKMGCFYDANGKIDIDLSGPYVENLGTGWQSLGSALQVVAFFTSFTKSTYKGYYQDIDTGLIFTKNRVYNPYISRFINSDPESILNNIDNCLNTNEYVFSSNSPVNLDAFNQSVFDKNSIPYASIKSPLWFRNYFNN